MERQSLLFRTNMLGFGIIQLLGCSLTDARTDGSTIEVLVPNAKTHSYERPRTLSSTAAEHYSLSD